MNELLKRFIAFAVAAVMLVGMVPTTAFAAEDSHHHDHQLNSEIQPFTSTGDLIAQVAGQLAESGFHYPTETEDPKLVSAVEAKSEHSYAEAESMLTMGFFSNVRGAKGEIPVAELNLNEKTMKKLVEHVLDKNYLSTIVNVSYVVREGIVDAVKFSMRDSFAAGLKDVGTVLTEVRPMNAKPLADGDGAGSDVPDAGTADCKHEKTTAVDEKPATCTKAGVKAHVNCDSCHKDFFKAEDGTLTPASDEALVIKALGHDYKLVAAKESTCTVQGNKEHYKCSRCEQLATKEGEVYTETTLDKVQLPLAEHQYQDVAEVPATCTQEGTKAHAKCSVCGKLAIKDADGKYTDTTADELVIAKLPHTPGELIPEVPATETAFGVQAHYECSVCHTKLIKEGDTFKEVTDEDLKIAKLACTHGEKTKIDAKAPTCEETGNIEHYKCNNCEKLFIMNEDGTFKEATKAEVTLEALGHDYQKVEAKAPTCEAAGNKEHYKCSRCDKLFNLKEDGTYEETTVEEVTEEALGHVYQKVEAKASTCTEQGNIEHYKCSVCGKLFLLDAESNTYNETTLEKVLLPLAEHQLVPVEGKEATCTEDGMHPHAKCSVCGKLFVPNPAGPESAMMEVTAEQLVIPATGHKIENPTFNWVQPSPILLDKDGNPQTDSQGNPKLNPELFFLDETMFKLNIVMPLLDKNYQPINVGATVDGMPILSVTLFMNPQTGAIEAMPTAKPDYWLDWNDVNGDGKMDAQEIAGAELHENSKLHACTGVSYTCPGCGETFTEEVEVKHQLIDQAYIESEAKAVGTAVATQIIGEYVEKKATEHYMATGTPPTEEQQNAWIAEIQPEAEKKAAEAGNMKAAQLMPEYNSALYIATSKVHPELKAELNSTALQIKQSWAKMCAFNEYYSRYFGYAAPHWTSKNTEADPMGAIIYVCNQQEQPFIPTYNKDFMVSMLTQAFMSYVMQYGGMMDAMLADGLAYVNRPGLTDVQKLVLLHDWIGENAVFDMQSLIDQTIDPSVGSDPIAMTAFGTLLNSQIPKAPGTMWDGAVCLGYAATFAAMYQQIKGVTAEQNRVNPLVDFVQIQYLSNVADCSVAAGDSGFGDGDAMFYSPHFFNAVKLDGQWYYIDACYDDINIEVISQYRVETDGNLSHDNFLLAPTTLNDMYDGNYAYVDSLYDGVQFNRVPDGQGGYKMRDNKGNVYETEAAAKQAQQADPEHVQIFYYYEKTEAPNEVAYTDTTYELAWFVNANSPIYYDEASGYFYYVSGVINSYSSMKDMFKDDDDDKPGNDLGMDQEDMLEHKYDPCNADQIVRRPKNAPDKPEKKQGGMSMKPAVDKHAEALFHFGYGSIGAEAKADVLEDSKKNNMEVGTTDGREGKYFAEVTEDKEFFNRYGDMTHSLAVMDGEIYFNMSNKIFKLGMSLEELATFKTVDEIQNLTIEQFKEYDDVTFSSNGKRFAGMSFSTDPAGERSVRYHPIAALNVHNVINWVDTDEDPETPAERQVVPTMFVSIATNFSNSFKDADGNMYVNEAYNFNPDYYRFMEDEEKTDESTPKNTNVEFMWCANIVDAMPVEPLVAEWDAYQKELATGEMAGETSAVKEVAVKAYCERDGFTELRSASFGLSNGSTRLIDYNEPAHMHTYVYNEQEGTNICSECLEAHDHSYNYEGVDVRFSWSKLESGKLTATAGVICEDPFCPVLKPLDNCVVTEKDGVYTATATWLDVTYTDTMTVEQFEHIHTYGDPAFKWENNGQGCTAVFTCTTSEDICRDLDGKRELKIRCAISKNAVGETVAKVEFNGKTYMDIYDPHDHVWVKDESKSVAPSCTESGQDVYVCTVCGEERVEVIASLGHDWVLVKDVPATCTTDGIKEFKCSRCGATKTETTLKTGHDYDENGICKNCGQKDPDMHVDKPFPFKDVPADNWAYDAVNYLYQRDLIAGISDDQFGPRVKMTRAMAVTILYGMAGRPEISAPASFSDVPTGTWYSNAVAWAASKGIVTGVGNNRFAPDKSLTREELVVIMSGYAEMIGRDMSKRADLSRFNDAGKVSGWAREDMQWAVANGLLSGFNDGTVRPQGLASRAEFAQIVYSFLTK